METNLTAIKQTALRHIPTTFTIGKTKEELIGLIDQYVGGEVGVRRISAKEVDIADLYIEATFLEKNPLRVVITAAIIKTLHDLGIRLVEKTVI